jgi:nickel-dependent lactate racemase
MLKPFITLTAALGLVLLTACGNAYGDRCATAIQCNGGNDKDVDACIATLNGAEDVAAAYDCGDAYFKLSDCIDTSGTCNSKRFETNCKAQSDALNKCEEAASGR